MRNMKSGEKTDLQIKLELAEKDLAELRSKVKQQDFISVKEAEDKYKFIVNAYGELMTLINREYVYEMVNNSWCRTFDKSREDFIGKTVAGVWGEQKFESEIKKKIDHCFQDNIYQEEDSFIIAGGKRKYYMVTYYPYKNDKGDVTHIVGVTDDITARKEAELALKKSEEELRILNEKKDKYLAIINADLETASHYVASLLPEEINNDGFQISWKMVPSAQLGGDSFGYHWIDNDHFAVYILDVTGHGVGSALHSVSVLNTLRFQTLVNIDFRHPDQVLRGLNEVFKMTENYSLFVTMWYCVYNRSGNELSCAGAGHPPLLGFSRENKPFRIESKNVIIGVEDNISFTSDTLSIEPGTTFYLYTDGAYEHRLPDGQMMGLEQLEKFLLENKTEQGAEITKLYNFLSDINTIDSLDDDFTMLKMRFH